jgi:hypothetical protein
MDLAPFYGWIVLLHIAGAFIFAVAHGVSMFSSFQIRRERDAARIRSLLDLSSSSFGAMYIGLLLLLVGGITAGVVGGHFARGWIWASLAILLAVAVAMYALATRYYIRVRSAVGMRSPQTPKDAPDPVAVPPDELGALLDTRRPELLTAIGLSGLLAILALMVLKPF